MGGWMDGWMDGWVGEWMRVRTVLMIANSNQKLRIFLSLSK